MAILWLIQLLLAAPSGPGTPFATITLVILDTARVAIIVLGLMAFITAPFAMAKAYLPGQQIRLLVLALFVISAVGTELEHLGDYANWRLIINMLAVVGSAWGQWSFFKFELPTQIKLQPDLSHVRAQLPKDASLVEDETNHEA